MNNMELIWEYQQTVSKQKIVERQLKQNESVKKLRELKTEIERIQNQIRGVLDQINQQKKELKTFEDDLVVIKEKIKRANDELYGGKLVSRELDAVEKSIALLKGKAEKEEEKALSVMDKLEQLDNFVQKLRGQLEEKKVEFRTLNKSYSDHKDLLLTQLDEINTTREKLMQQIEPESLGAYRDFCAKFSDNRALALLENGICTGCHMGISFEKIKMSKNSNDIATCDNCGRWLLFK